MRLCREKTRRAKAHLELNLASAVQDSKKHFCKSINNKRRTKQNENLHALLGVGRNIVTKAEVLNAFSASVFTVRLFVLRVLSTLSWKAGTGSRMKPPQSKGKWLVTCYTT